MGCGSSTNSTSQTRETRLMFADNRYRRNDDLTYKVVLLGDVFVGKTSILSSLQHQGPVSNYSPTIGFAYSQKVISLKSGVF